MDIDPPRLRRIFRIREAIEAGRTNVGSGVTNEGTVAAQSGVSLTVVLPAYNEARRIGQTLRDTERGLQDAGISYELIVVSDGSSDGTSAIVREMSSRQIFLEELAVQTGKGAAIKRGLRLASGTYVGFLDADGDISPASLIGLYRILIDTNADGCVASKVHAESTIQYPRFRRVQSYVFRQFVGLALGLSVSDSQTGAKVFTKASLEKAMPLVSANGFDFDFELLVALELCGFTLREGPVQISHQFDSRVRWTDAGRMLLSVWRVARWRRSLLESAGGRSCRTG